MICPFGRESVDLTKREVTEAEKCWLAEQINLKKRTAKSLSLQYKLTPQTLNRYARNALSGVQMNNSNGRPKILDSIAEKSLCEELGGDKRIQMTQEQYEDRFIEHAKSTASRRGKGTAHITKVSRGTLKNFDRDNLFLTKNAERTTDAREKACADWTNAVSFAAMCQAVIPHIKYPLILNFDAKQSKVGDESNKKHVAKFIGSVKQGKSVKTKKSDGTKGITCYFIKTYTLMSAAGYLGPQVDVIASPSMKKNEIDVHRVEGLGPSLGVDAYSYVVFCKTRGCCTAFYEWYNIKVMIPYVNSLRQKFSLEDDDFAFVNCDGEALQCQYMKIKLFKILYCIIQFILGNNQAQRPKYIRLVMLEKYFYHGTLC
jgi:hypothetical protein